MAINRKSILILAVISIVLFIAGNGIINFTNPDEVFYTQIAKEMRQQDTWLTPYLFGQPNFEKPIFTYWLLRISLIVFGVSSFGARFFPALFAAAGVICIYMLAAAGYRDERKAFISALVLASSGLYIGLARAVFTDMIFSVLVLFSMASFFYGYAVQGRKGAGIIMLCVFSALAVLTKGLLGVILPFLAIALFLTVRKDLKFMRCKSFLWGGAIFAVIVLPWHLFMIKKYGGAFLYEFFYNDHIRRVIEAEHRRSDTWFFYPLSTVLSFFPWSVFVAAAFFYFVRKMWKNISSPFYLFIFIWIALFFAIFQSAHSKLVSYILPIFPAIALITGDFIDDLMSRGSRAISALFSFTCLIFLVVPIALVVIITNYPNYISSKSAAYSSLTVYLAEFAAITAAMIFCIIRKKTLIDVYLICAQALVALTVIFTFSGGFENYISSKEPCLYLVRNHNPGNTIICSKSLVRGVRFYTDRGVAVVNVGGKPFFSPHPVPYLDSDEKIKNLLKSQPVTYGILTRSSVEDITRVSKSYNFRMEALKVFGNEFVVRVRSE